MLASEDMQEAELRISPQWVAGFLDGEGSVHVNKCTESGKSFFTVSVKITQKDPKILFLICKVIGSYGSFGSYVGISNTRSAAVTWTGRSALPILNYVKDYVIVKRREVETAIKICSLIGGRRGRRNRQRMKDREELCGKLYELNQRNKQTLLGKEDKDAESVA